MQVQKKESFSRNNRHKNESGLIKAMKNIVETSGGRPITQGFYRGLNSCLLRDFFFARKYFNFDFDFFELLNLCIKLFKKYFLAFIFV